MTMRHIMTYRTLGELLRAYLSDLRAFGPTDLRVKNRAEEALAYVRAHPEAFE